MICCVKPGVTEAPYAFYTVASVCVQLCESM